MKQKKKFETPKVLMVAQVFLESDFLQSFANNTAIQTDGQQTDFFYDLDDPTGTSVFNHTWSD